MSKDEILAAVRADAVLRLGFGGDSLELLVQRAYTAIVTAPHPFNVNPNNMRWVDHGKIRAAVDKAHRQHLQFKAFQKIARKATSPQHIKAGL